MDLRMARLCLDCEEIFEGKPRCPKCDSESWHPIMAWIRPMSEAGRRVVRMKDVLVLAKRPQRELLTVPPFRRRNRDKKSSLNDIHSSSLSGDLKLGGSRGRGE